MLVAGGEEVSREQPLFLIEAMKMETTVTAPFDGRVAEIVLPDGSMVESEDLVVVLEPANAD